MLLKIGTKDAFDICEYAFEQVVKYAKSYTIKHPIGFPSLISRILITQKPYIVYAKDEIIFSSSLLNFTHKLFVGKHIFDIVLLNIPNINESDHVIDENMIDVSSMLEDIFSNFLC